MLEPQPRDRSIDGGTLRWGLTMTVRSFLFTAAGILSSIAITAPVAIALLVLSTVIGGTRIYLILLLVYWILLVTLGIGIASLLRKFKWKFNRSALNTEKLPGSRRMGKEASDGDILLILGLLMGGYLMFVTVLLALAAVAGLFLGVLPAALVVIGLVAFEKHIYVEYEKSMIAGGIRITRAIYVAVTRPNFRQRKTIKQMEREAQRWSLIPINRSTGFGSPGYSQ